MSLQLISLWMSKDESAYLTNLSADKLVYKNFNNLEQFEIHLQATKGIVVIAINSNPESICDFNSGHDLFILNMAKKLLKRPLTHVILLAEIGSPQDRLFWKSYSSAAYLLKPFDPLELIYTAQNLAVINSPVILADSNFEINVITREVYFKGKKLILGPKLFEMLKYFIENPGQTISREQFMHDVFATPNYLDDRSIDANIKKLRKKTSYELIETIRGIGYRYNNNK